MIMVSEVSGMLRLGSEAGELYGLESILGLGSILELERGSKSAREPKLARMSILGCLTLLGCRTMQGCLSELERFPRHQHVAEGQAAEQAG